MAILASEKFTTTNLDKRTCPFDHRTFYNFKLLYNCHNSPAAILTFKNCTNCTATGPENILERILCLFCLIVWHVYNCHNSPKPVLTVQKTVVQLYKNCTNCTNCTANISRPENILERILCLFCLIVSDVYNCHNSPKLVQKLYRLYQQYRLYSICQMPTHQTPGCTRDLSSRPHQFLSM